MVRYLIVDPPEGWRYGFPKCLMEVPHDVGLEDVVFPKEVYKDLLGFYRYPEEMIDLALKYSRYWIEEFDK